MPSKMNRRQFGVAAAALSSAAAAPAAETTYTGALDGFDKKVSLPDFDPVAWTMQRYANAPLALTYKPASKKATEAWQKKLRGKVLELIGGFPKEKAPLQPVTLEVRDFPQYRREKFVIQTRPGMALLGYLLTPKNAKGPLATMICVPGHGRGVDDIVGIDEKGRDRTDKAGYQHDFAIQAVEAGLATVAIEPIAFGCRRDARSAKRGLGNSACQPVAGAALLLGETMVGWRSYDVVRTIDWIETRKELDGARVGLMGISGGGTITSFAAAVEPRIKAAMISGYLNTFRDSIVAISHCIDNYVPGILNWCENYDVASLIAPRPLYVESGTRDSIFPIEASKSAFAHVKQVYAALGAEELAQHEVFEGEHLFHGGAGLPFLAKHLKA
ncbi:MAG TPA: alpha/beta hydrolase family protein [Bryobacteraceae bacterium]|nr:alpha/beta hydrolase family protein [Bryobacteraceae bacterium]